MLLTVRILIEAIFNIIGILNIKPLFLSNKSIKKRIAFQAYSIHLAQFYQTIISELLKEDEKIEIIFIILPHPHFSLKSTFELREYVNLKLHIPRKNIKFYWETIWEKFDMIIYSDVYAKFPIRKTKNCILMHGPGLTSRNVKKNILRKTLSDFDLVLLNGEYDYNLVSSFYINYRITSKLHSVGLPFLDRLQKPDMTKQMYNTKFSLEPNKQTILIAPSWSGLNLVQKQGINYFDEIIPILKNFDVNIIIKLHVCSLNHMMNKGMDWQKRLEKLVNGSTIQRDDDFDDIPALKYADILITDISSRAFNFMLLDKPVILYFPIGAGMDNWDRARLNLMQQGSFVSKTPSDIWDALDKMNDQKVMSKKRYQVSRQCFTNYGKATNEVIRLIKDGLGC